MKRQSLMAVAMLVFVAILASCGGSVSEESLIGKYKVGETDLVYEFKEGGQFESTIGDKEVDHVAKTPGKWRLEGDKLYIEIDHTKTECEFKEGTTEEEMAEARNTYEELAKELPVQKIELTVKSFSGSGMTVENGGLEQSWSRAD